MKDVCLLYGCSGIFLWKLLSYSVKIKPILKTHFTAKVVKVCHNCTSCQRLKLKTQLQQDLPNALRAGSEHLCAPLSLIEDLICVNLTSSIPIIPVQTPINYIQINIGKANTISEDRGACKMNEILFFL